MRSSTWIFHVVQLPVAQHCARHSAAVDDVAAIQSAETTCHPDRLVENGAHPGTSTSPHSEVGCPWERESGPGPGCATLAPITRAPAIIATMPTTAILPFIGTIMLKSFSGSDRQATSTVT